MAIPEYQFYENTYVGVSIPLEDWERIATRADEQVKFFERTYTVSEPEENSRDKAVCAIADQMYVYEVIEANELNVDESGNIVSSSVSIGSVSTSTKAPSISTLGLDMTEKGRLLQYYRIAQRYLDIFRGVRG